MTGRESATRLAGNVARGACAGSRFLPRELGYLGETFETARHAVEDDRVAIVRARRLQRLDAGRGVRRAQAVIDQCRHDLARGAGIILADQITVTCPLLSPVPDHGQHAIRRMNNDGAA